MYRKVYIFDSMDEFRQLSIRNIVVSNLSKAPLKRTGLCYQLDSFLWSELLDFRWVSDQHAPLLLPFGRGNISQWKEILKKIRRSKLFLIRPSCVRKVFLSDPSVLDELTIRPNCARSCLWSDSSALESA